MAAAAQAHYAKQQARREACKAALLSQVSALSNSSQPMDPKLQAELERLIRVRNFEQNTLPLELVFQDGRVMTPDEAKYPNTGSLCRSKNNVSPFSWISRPPSFVS
jgi:hypothetical protein